MRKNSFLTFCFAFIPGAGEMYLGMMKKGLLIMLGFWGACAISALFSAFEFSLWFCPVVWFYSFFDTMNCRWLDENQRHQMDDRAYALLTQNGSLAGSLQNLYTRKPLLIGWGLILLGGYLALDSVLFPIIEYICKQFGIDSSIINYLSYRLPSAIVAALIIALGIRLVRGKKNQPQDDGYIEYKGGSQNDQF